MAYGCGHAPNLPIHTFRQSDLQPAIRYGLSDANRGIPRPESPRLADPNDTGSARATPPNHHASTESAQGRVIRNPLNLHPIDLSLSRTWLAEPSLQPSIICEHHQAFAVHVQPTGRIDIWLLHKVCQRRATRCIRELTQNTKRLVDEQNLGNGQASNSNLTCPMMVESESTSECESSTSVRETSTPATKLDR